LAADCGFDRRLETVLFELEFVLVLEISVQSRGSAQHREFPMTSFPGIAIENGDELELEDDPSRSA
jgi:hypothetical protein